MARLSARYKHFWTTGRVYQHFWANFASASGDGNASGDTLTVTTSILTGEENVSEETSLVAVAISIIPGSAFEEIFAQGATLTISTSLITGEEDVSEETNVVTVTTSLIPGHADVDVLGEPALHVNLFLTAGSASELGSAVAAGQLLILNSEVIPGSAVSGASGIGTLFTLNLLLTPGTAFAVGEGASVSGSTITVFTSLIDGQATGQTDATANGDTLIVTTSLDVGAATGGRDLVLVVELIPGAATGNATLPSFVRTGGPIMGPYRPLPETLDATARGAVMQARVHFEKGNAFALPPPEVRIEYVESPPISQIVPVGSAHSVTATGYNAFVQSLLLEAGAASGVVNATAPGAEIEDQWDWGPHNELVRDL